MGIKGNILGTGGHLPLSNTPNKNQGWALSALFTSKKVQNQRLISDTKESIQLMAKCRIKNFSSIFFLPLKFTLPLLKNFEKQSETFVLQ